MDISLTQLLEFVKAYSAEVLNLGAETIKNMPKEEAYCSEAVNELTTSLSKAQAEYAPVDFSQVNPYTGKKYPELNDVIEAVRLALAKNNLSFTQILLATDEGQKLLLTRLWHNSGQWIGSKSRIVAPSDDPHEYDSIVQHHKKIDLMALLGVAAADDPSDDDAERGMKRVRNKEIKGTDLDYQQAPKPKGTPTNLITKDHLEELEIELEEYPDLLSNIYKKYHIESLADIPDCEYRKTVDKIRQIKELRRTNVVKDTSD
jgi:hypothetical protein